MSCSADTTITSFQFRRRPESPEKESGYGGDYSSFSMSEFDKMIAKEELIEYAKYVDHYYGTPRKYVEETLESGKDVILEIEIQGAAKIKKRYPEALMLFVAPPSARELCRRLTERGTESREDIDSRMRRAVEESEGIENYDYLVVNDDLDECVEETHNLIQREYNSIGRQLDFIRKIQGELKEYLKGE